MFFKGYILKKYVCFPFSKRLAFQSIHDSWHLLIGTRPRGMTAQCVMLSSDLIGCMTAAAWHSKCHICRDS